MSKAKTIHLKVWRFWTQSTDRDGDEVARTIRIAATDYPTAWARLVRDFPRHYVHSVDLPDSDRRVAIRLYTGGDN